METHSIAVEKRTATGKGAAHKIRAAGRIPAVVYGAGQEPVHIACSPSDVRAVVRSERGRNTILNLEVDGGEQVVAMIKDVQVHPLSQRIIHCDFLRVVDDVPVTVDVPLTFVGKAAGVTAGGILQPLRRKVRVRCLPGRIPGHIEVDVTNLEIGQSISVKDLNVPEGITLTYKVPFSVVTVLK